MPAELPRESGTKGRRPGPGNGATRAGWSLPSTGPGLTTSDAPTRSRNAPGHKTRQDSRRPVARAREVAIVGLGNELAHDDGVGIYVARRLATLLEDRDDVEVVLLPWAGFALLDALVGRRRAIIVDCLVSGDHLPGSIVRLSEEDFRGSVRLNSFHDINYPTALELGRRMGWSLPAEIAVWGIEGSVVDRFGEGLTPSVRVAANRAVREILEYLGSSANGAQCQGARGSA